MVSGDSPAVARRRVRLVVRRLREEMGLTQGQVAESLDWSLSKVQRIESGEVTLSGTDLRALLNLFAVTDADTVAGLVEDAKSARRRGWWDKPPYRAQLTVALMQLLQFESQATAIRYFSHSMLPGVLQTRQQAEAVLKVWTELGQMSEEQLSARLEVRMRRHEQVFDRDDPPDYYLVLDESVLYRQIGGPEVALGQLQHLLRYVSEHKVILQIVPFEQATLAAVLSPFTIVDLEAGEDAILYRENQMHDEIVHLTEVVARHRSIFEELTTRALTPAQSALQVEARVAALTRLDS
jgi:transcriptional regulator with XRE-family HTH domain